MDLRYVHNDQPVAEGERAVFYEGGKLCIRTSLLSSSLTDPAMMTVTYRLREVYDKAAVQPQPVNHAPVAQDSNSSTVDLGVTP